MLFGLDDHFHALFVLRERTTLARLMNGLKRHTARHINLLRGVEGPLWQEGFHDHAIRDDPDLWHHVRYIHENPIRLGWVTRAEDYFWSTAHASRQADTDWDKVAISGL